jgi:hypothetical protein
MTSVQQSQVTLSIWFSRFALASLAAAAAAAAAAAFSAEVVFRILWALGARLLAFPFLEGPLLEDARSETRMSDSESLSEAAWSMGSSKSDIAFC